jgi:hypothetical protein
VVLKLIRRWKSSGEPMGVVPRGGKEPRWILVLFNWDIIAHKTAPEGRA